MSDASFWNNLIGASALPWGSAASPSVAMLAAHARPEGTVLVPGCGYGRNALALAERGFRVTAYDIASAGISRAQSEFAHPNVAYSVADTAPSGQYDAILCHFLVHLFQADARRQLIDTLSQHLAPSGFLLMTALSTRAPFFGNGSEIEPDTWSNPGWVPIHFYSPESLAAEMQPLSIIETREVEEPEDKPSGRVSTQAVYALARK